MRQSAHPGCAGSIALPPNSPLCPWRARSATALRDKAAVETPAAGASGLQLSVTAALPLLLLLMRHSELRPVSAAPGAAHPLKLVLYELCRAVTRETLGVGKLCDLLADAQLLPAAIAPVLHSNLADVFWFLASSWATPPRPRRRRSS